MTIAADVSGLVRYAGNGTTTVFAVPFKIYHRNDLTVSLISNVTGARTAQVYGTHYTLNAALTQLTMITAPSAAYELDLRSHMPRVQTTSIRNQGTFLPELHENAFDKLTRLLQDAARGRMYTLRMNEYEDQLDELPTASARANKYLKFDANGAPELGALTSSGDLSADLIGDFLYPTSTAETNAAVTIVNQHRPWGHILRYGNNTTPGTTNMAAAAQAAVDQFAQGGACPWIPKDADTCNFTASVTLPDADIKIFGDGTVTSTGALTNGIFYQTNRGRLTEIDGLTVLGKSPLFRRQALDSPLPWSDHYIEFRISRCKFKQDATSYAAYLYGAREGFFEFCHFETCKGVYSDYSINTEFVGCSGKNAVQFIDAQAGSEGIKFLGGTALGMTYCVKATNMIGVQILGVMWDYNDNPVHLTACQQIAIVGSYITCRTQNGHVISIIPDGATRSEDVYIIANPMLANVQDNGLADGTGRIINAEDVDYITIQGNQCKLYRDIAIQLDTCTQAKVMDNNIIPHPSADIGVDSVNPANYSVKTVTSDDSVVIENNTVINRISTVTTRAVRNNRGFVTENSGEATLNGGATSRTIAHGLAMTPLKSGIQLTQTSTIGSGVEMWISAVDATNITVTFRFDPVSDVSVSWSARISPG